MASFIFIIAGLNLLLGYLLALLLAPHFNLSPCPSTEASGIAGQTIEDSVPLGANSGADENSAGADQNASAADANAAEETTPATPAADEKPELVGELIEEFKDDLVRYREHLASLDRRMRAGNEMQDTATMQACLKDLCQANANYLAQSEDSNNRLQRGCQAAEEHKQIGRQLGAALNQHSGEVRGANDNLERINPEHNDLLDRQKIFTETARLIDASHTLRDTLDDCELQLSGRAAPSTAAVEGELSGRLVSRSRLEAALADCWRADPDRQQPLSLGLVDMDRCRELNDSRGIQAADRILSTVAQLVAGALQAGQLATRLSGEKFLLLMTGTNGRASTAALEHVRQQVETLQFQAGSEQFGAQVSCAVAEPVPGDTIASILDRLENTLQEAKRYGRNRTFFHDGKLPTPVVPPILSLEPRTQEI
ncbi:MAG TPA: GGDEF domain-containing protein [Pirellulales bacterium]|nr:GGDEF domain-containing protein [Pirellulales bacterium]